MESRGALIAFAFRIALARGRRALVEWALCLRYIARERFEFEPTSLVAGCLRPNRHQSPIFKSSALLDRYALLTLHHRAMNAHFLIEALFVLGVKYGIGTYRGLNMESMHSGS